MSVTSLSGLSGLPSLFIFDSEVKSQKAPLTNTANDPQVKSDIAYFTSTIAKLKTPADFLANPKLVNFVLTAFGLQSESSAMGIVKQVLTQDPTDKNALANQLADPRWQQLASALDFFHRGLAGLQSYTSTTSQAIQAGSVTLTLNTSPNFKLGQEVSFADAANPHQNFLTGAVTAISGSSVTINVPAGFGAVGSGTIAKWTVYANNAKSGGTTTLASQVVQNITQKYVTAQFEDSLGQQSTPAEEAAYFLRNVGGITSTYQLLGDRVLLDVVEGALGIPKNIAEQPVDDQAQLIQSQLDIKTLQNPNTQSFASATADQTTLQGVNQVTSAAQSALKNVVGQIQSISQQYSFLAGITDPAGSNAAAIATQQSSVPALVQASGLIGAANQGLGNIQTALGTLNQLVAAAPTADSATLAADQSQFQILTQQIQSALSNASYTSPSDGSTGNLLTDGSLSLSTTVKAGETITFNGLGLDTAGISAQLNAANSAFQATLTGGAVDPTVAANLSALGTTFTGAQTQVTGELQSWNQGVQDGGPFVTALSSGSLNTGLAAGQDAQSRATTVSGLVNQLQSLAAQSADPAFAGDRSALNTQAAQLISQINSTIATPGTGVSDNLLENSQSYALLGSDSLTIRGAHFDTGIGAPLASADISTQGGAQSLQNLIANTLQPAILTAQSQLSTDVTATRTSINTFDPRAPIDAQLRQLVSSIPGIETGAGVNGRNLLSTTATSIGVSLKTTGDNFVIQGHSEFDQQVNGVLQQAVAALLTSDAPPTGLLEQALGNAGSIQTKLNGDVAKLAPDQAKVSSVVAQQAKQTAASQANPYTGASAGAQLLVQRYMALQDAQNTSNNPNSYLTTLLNTSTEPSIINIDLSGLNLTA